MIQIVVILIAKSRLSSSVFTLGLKEFRMSLQKSVQPAVMTDGIEKVNFDHVWDWKLDLFVGTLSTRLQAFRIKKIEMTGH